MVDVCDEKVRFRDREPVALGAIVSGLVNAVLLLLAAFDVAELTAEQTAAVFFAVNAVLLTVTAVLTRRVVLSPYTVRLAMAPSPEELGPPPLDAHPGEHPRADGDS